MRRREFIALLGGAAVALPLPTAAHAQPAKPIIGYLSSRSPEESADDVAAFHRGLIEAGYVEGQNITIEYRWALGQYDRLPALATDLARRPVAVIAAVGGLVTALAAKAATATIPIVFVSGGDPIKSGLVTSLNRPSGNVTGMSLLSASLGAKRLELLREVVPGAVMIAMLVNPSGPDSDLQKNEVEAAARTLGLRVHVVRAGSEGDFVGAFASALEQRADALLVSSDTLFTIRRDRLVALAQSHALPVIYAWPHFVRAGGLMSYGTPLTEAYRRAGVYVGRILKGATPADLPIEQTTKIELVVNLKTAKALGLAIPPALLARADEVIE